MIMGGAIRVKGNVDPKYGGDDTAEWNIYWDAKNAGVVFNSNVKKILFALDATNNVPVNSAFVKRFGKQYEYQLSHFAGSSWAFCTHFEKVYDAYTHYYAWDALTAAYVIKPSLVKLEEVYVKLITEGASEGRTLPCSKDDAGARLCYLPYGFEPEEFYSLALKACAQHF